MDLIIGYGNTLRGDDGVGPAAIAWLTQTTLPFQKVRLLSCHQLTPELAADLAEAERVVFVDAAPPGLGAIPGAIRACQLQPRATLPAGVTHHFDPELLLALSAALYGSAPRAALLLTVSAGDFSLREGLSAPLQAALPTLEERILAWLAIPSVPL